MRNPISFASSGCFARMLERCVVMSAEETFSDKETRERADAALKRMLATPPRLHKDSKLGKRKDEKND